MALNKRQALYFFKTWHYINSYLRNYIHSFNQHLPQASCIHHHEETSSARRPYSRSSRGRQGEALNVIRRISLLARLGMGEVVSLKRRVVCIQFSNTIMSFDPAGLLQPWPLFSKHTVMEKTALQALAGRSHRSALNRKQAKEPDPRQAAIRRKRKRM